MTIPLSAPTGSRLLSLDALRGFAVMGIVLMNIVSYAMPEQAYVNPAAWGGQSVADLVTWAVSYVLFDGKMRGLFSLLFGASMLLVIDRADLAGRDGRKVHLWRAFWLFWFGVAHFLLLWWGDILMIYALVSMIALFFVHRQPLDLVKWAFIAFGLHFVVVAAFAGGLYAMQHEAMLPGASHALVADYRAMLAIIGQPNTPEIARELALYRSTFPAIFEHQLHALADHASVLAYAGLDTLGFMLLGMAMLKGGFLTGQWDAAQYRRTARHCFLIGLPPMIALAVWAVVSGFDTLTMFGIFLAWSFPFRIPLTVGFAALLLVLIQRHAHHALIVRVAATGRMAFSNYLGTSLLMAILFQGWGLGLFGHIPRAPLYLLVPVVWLLMLLWSKAWLDRFAYGPMEWAWRSLARGQPQPMRRITTRS